jgi:YfiH family protein
MKYLSFANLEIIQTDKSDGSIEGRESVRKILPVESGKHTIIEMDQVHSDTIAVIRQANVADQKIPTTDAVITNQKGVWLMAKIADCVPLVLFDPNTKVVAVVHSGWRGTVKQIATKTLKTMETEFFCKAKDIKVFIGSSIRSCCYVFNESPAQDADPEWKKYITVKPDGWHIDLVGHLSANLQQAGVLEANIIDIGECAFHNLNHFSYFRQKKTAEERGLNAMVVQLRQ